MFIAAAAVAVVGIIMAAVLLAPKGTTQRSDDLQSVTHGEVRSLAAAEWVGDDSFHYAEGTVQLLEDDRGLFLFFEDFDARSGPDVYLYVSTATDGVWRSDEVTKVLVPEGAADGQATLRGDFRVDLPDGLTASSIGSALLWCDQFSEPFGHALFS